MISTRTSSSSFTQAEGGTSASGNIGETPTAAPSFQEHPEETTEHQYYGFSSRAPQVIQAKKEYFKMFIGGTFVTILLVFCVFSIFWGSLWKLPVGKLHGVIVDFDGGEVGTTVMQAIVTVSESPASASKVYWHVVPASEFPNGPSDLAHYVHEQHSWVGISINPGSSQRLSTSLSSPNASYNGEDAMTVFGVEGRNENAYRSLIRPSFQVVLDVVSKSFAVQMGRTIANNPNLSSVLATSPQTITTPISYTIVNLAPFDEPVATAVTFIGLLYQTILSFFVVMVSLSAREASGLHKTLRTKSLVLLRLGSSFAAYFALSLFYSLLSVAFQLSMDRKFGHAGFLVFWMLNYVGMLATGLALESLITLLTVKGIPFFMLTWIITNVSVCSFPIEVMPSIFRYGYAFPFYNTSIGIRTVLFGTKNHVAFSFGVLLAWVAVSCISLTLIQIWRRRRDEANDAAAAAAVSEVKGEKTIEA